MSLVTSNQFKLTPDLMNLGTGALQGFAVGQQYKQNQFVREQAELAAQQKQQGGQFKQQLAVGNHLLDQQKLRLEQDKFKSKQQTDQREAQQLEDIRENDALTQIALNADNIPDPNKVREYLSTEIKRLKGEGRDTSTLENTISLPDDQMKLQIEQHARQGQSISDQAKSKFENEKLTTLQRNAIAAGLQPGTSEFSDFMIKNSGKSMFQIGSGEKAEDIAFGKLTAQRRDDLHTDASEAEDDLALFNQMSAIAVKTGFLEPIKLTVGRALKAIGINQDFIDISNAEALNAMTTKLVNASLRQNTGVQTDQDAIRARNEMAQLEGDPRANVFKTNVLKAGVLRKVQHSTFVDDLMEQGIRFQKAEQQWKAFVRNTPQMHDAVRGEDGLPVFYFQFSDFVKQNNPNISDMEISKLWNELS